jgi:hypothetical protein
MVGVRLEHIIGAHFVYTQNGIQKGTFAKTLRERKIILCKFLLFNAKRYS